ncbi:MAG: hypothetical protein FJY75_00730 [Candidatus Eisenbacteria bacterium]|uniref:Uncharacterized protein n=1 Tax=Eiseniibacteriota bacterium TaxID=2212470 RepID=A0A938BMP3_UNCEI|nr:hypothetical protein [Candidatus Eisenbacteria bacterium]
MTTSPRKFLILFGAAAALLVCGGVVLGVAVQRAGMIEIDVRATSPEGCEIRGLRLPGCLVHGVLRCMPRSRIPAAYQEFASTALRRDALRGIRRALDRCPDGVLVEVESSDDKVRIEKRGRHLIVVADTPDEAVRVQVPMAAVGALLEHAAGT